MYSMIFLQQYFFEICLFFVFFCLCLLKYNLLLIFYFLIITVILILSFFLLSQLSSQQQPTQQRLREVTCLLPFQIKAQLFQSRNSNYPIWSVSYQLNPGSITEERGIYLNYENGNKNSNYYEPICNMLLKKKRRQYQISVIVLL